VKRLLTLSIGTHVRHASVLHHAAWHHLGTRAGKVALRGHAGELLLLVVHHLLLLLLLLRRGIVEVGRVVAEAVAA
jgi:hypothetical protein